MNYEEAIDTYNTLKIIFDKNLAYKILKYNLPIKCTCKFNLFDFIYNEYCDICHDCTFCCMCYLCDFCEKKNIDCFDLNLDTGKKRSCELCLKKRFKLVEFFPDEYCLMNKYENKTVIEKVDDNDIVYYYKKTKLLMDNNLSFYASNITYIETGRFY